MNANSLFNIVSSESQQALLQAKQGFGARQKTYRDICLLQYIVPTQNASATAPILPQWPSEEVCDEPMDECAITAANAFSGCGGITVLAGLESVQPLTTMHSEAIDYATQCVLIKCDKTRPTSRITKIGFNARRIVERIMLAMVDSLAECSKSNPREINYSVNDNPKNYSYESGNNCKSSNIHVELLIQKFNQFPGIEPYSSTHSTEEADSFKSDSHWHIASTAMYDDNFIAHVVTDRLIGWQLWSQQDCCQAKSELWFCYKDRSLTPPLIMGLLDVLSQRADGEAVPHIPDPLDVYERYRSTASSTGQQSRPTACEMNPFFKRYDREGDTIYWDNLANAVRGSGADLTKPHLWYAVYLFLTQIGAIEYKQHKPKKISDCANQLLDLEYNKCTEAQIRNKCSNGKLKDLCRKTIEKLANEASQMVDVYNEQKKKSRRVK